MKHERIYLNDEDRRVYIDTYIRNEGNGGLCAARDAILVIPGGAYRDVCDAREGEPVAISFFERGYNAFVLHYRVGQAGDVYPKQLIDAGTAMLYIREHAKELRINPERVFAVGFSAGGHLCASLATMYNYPEAVEAFGSRAAKIRPTGAILAYPVTSLYEKTHINSFKNLLGRPNADFTEDERAKFSIENIVTKESSPMYIWHTAEDDAVPVEASLKLGYNLAKLGVSFMLDIFPYGRHGISIATDIIACPPDLRQPIASRWVGNADEWMKTLKNY